MRRIFIAMTLLMVSAVALAQTSMEMTVEGQDCARWVKAHFSGKSLPPFSFTYDGVPSEQFIRKWKFRKAKPSLSSDGVLSQSFYWTDRKSGLQVEAKVRTFSDFNAMEWVLSFRNTSDRNSGQVSNVKAADLDVASGKDGTWNLFHAEGSDAKRNDFMALTKEYSVGDSLVMVPDLGRSSSKAFPYFNIKSPEGGMVFAIGWSGTWKARIARPSKERMNVSTGLKNLDTYLLPGEEIRTPLMAMVPWQGEDRMDGQNILRRFILAHHHPRMNGVPVEAPLCSGIGMGDPSPCSEYSCLTSEYAVALIHRYQQFGVTPEVFWLDAGWYGKATDWKDGRNWYNTAGDWEPDSTRFPRGLGEIADAAHETGARFMLWFEPERVVRNSPWAYEHPEYMLMAGGGTPVPTPLESRSYDSFLVNLGNPEANKWLCEEVARLIRDNKVDYYRQDYNVDPEWFWYSNDEEGRHGICEIRYIEGLYRFWDYLLEEFPGLLIDNCASGGRRLDLEATSRSIPLWRTDYEYGEPVGYQSHTYGLSQWLPVSGTGVMKTDPFTSRSGFSAGVIYKWSVTSPEYSILDMQKNMAEFNSIRHYFLEDFYPLTGYGDITRDDIWMAYQLDKPSDGTGRIVAFRRDQCKEDRIVVKLRGLDPDKVYVLESQDTFERTEKTGEDLGKGLELRLDNPRSSLYYKYWLR